MVSVIIELLLARRAWHTHTEKCSLSCRTFDLSQPIDLGLNSKDSLMIADDGAAVFTTPISYHGNLIQ